jgi:2-amino-4-hydroxy-6-hydroxymethyldihydropteridine diphosphokinase
MGKNQAQAEVYIGLGGNMRGSVDAFEQALNDLSEFIHGMRRSKLYLSAAWGVVDQDDFVNMAIAGTTELGPPALLQRLLQLELALGRDRENSQPWGPRLIDLDILYWQGVKIQTEELSIPHPHLLDRSFALIPVLELNHHLLREPHFKALNGEILNTMQSSLREVND